MSSWSPTNYITKNWTSYNTALKQRGSLSIWFDPEMAWYAVPTGKRERHPEFSDAAIQICLTMKVLFGMPLRQTTGFVESLLRLIGTSTGKLLSSRSASLFLTAIQLLAYPSQSPKDKFALGKGEDRPSPDLCKKAHDRSPLQTKKTHRGKPIPWPGDRSIQANQGVKI